MGIPHLPGQLLPWRNSSWRHQKWDFFQEKNSHGIDILLENRNCCSKEGVAPPHPLSSVLRDPHAPELLTEHGKYPGKEAAISFSCFFSKNPKIPLLLSFTLCWIQICKFHPWGATEIFPERFFFFVSIILELFSWKLSAFYPKIAALPLSRLTQHPARYRKINKGKNKRTNPQPGSHQILRIPNFPVPGGSYGGIPELQ